MKKNLFLLFLIVCLFVSCRHDILLPNPNIYPDNGRTESSDPEWHAPGELKATQGKKRSITLQWEPIKSAIRYKIYRSENEYSTFIQIGETKGRECEFKLKLEPGYDMYYRVTAVDITGKESEMSSTKRATTLAKPIINIIEGKDGTADSEVYVSWYMNNVDAYSDSVYYNVFCLDENNKEIQQLTSKGDKTTVLFTGLNPNTNYFYRVDAYSSENDVEKSDVVDAATARRLRPDPVSNFVVEQGVSKDAITLSFELPNFVDILVGKNLYEPAPVYFKIYRRVFEEGENNKPFQLIKDDFGVSYKTDDKKPATQVIDYTKVKFGDAPEDYTPGKVITYTDKSTELKRGEKYEYKIQSFAYVDKVISSDNSIALSSGWLLPNFTFETQKLNYIFDAEGKTKISASLKFNFAMDTFEIPYKFKITEVKRGLTDSTPSIQATSLTEHETTETEPAPAPTPESYLVEAETVEEIVNFTRNFYSLKEEEGYYSYKITIFSAEDNELDSYNAIGESLVTEDMNIPKIGDVKVTTGYADRIELEWGWNPAYKYTLKYWDANGESGEFTNDELLKNQEGSEEPVKYQDITAKPGVERTYQLVIDSSGFHVPSSNMKGTIPLKPILIPNYSYDKISVGIENPSGSKENYTVTATFEDTDLSNSYKLEPSKNDNYFDFNIVSTPANENATAIDAAVAGAKVKVTVTENKPLTITTYNNVSEGIEAVAEPENTSVAQLTSEIITATIGQALMDISASEGTYSDYIEVKWNKILGAENYVIFRDRYHIINGIGKYGKPNLKLQSGLDKYVVTINKDGIASVKSCDEDLGQSVSVTYDKSTERFILKDLYRPFDETNDAESTWKKGQSEITWGAPNKYTIVPVLSEADADRCEKDNKDIVTIDNVKIENSKNAMGGTKGFGWNVQSSKGTYSDQIISDKKINNGIEIKWTTPYFGNTSGYFVFKRDVGRDDNGKITYGEWTKLPTSVNVNSYVDKNVTQGKLYDYAVVDVKYAKQNPDPIFINDQRTGEGGVEVKDALGFMLPKATISGVTDKNDGTEEIQFLGQYMNGALNDMIDGYVIQVRNNNIDSNWHDIKDVPITETNKGETLFTEIVNNDNGLLKVLRDYKHYFRICAYKNVNGEKVYSLADNDITDGIMTAYIKWGSRQITIDEFAKAAIIGMSTGMEQERGDRGSYYNGDVITGLKSTSSFNLGPSDYTLTFVYNNYVANHKAKGSSGKEVNAVKINGTLKARGGSAGAFQTHYWTSSPISVTYKGNTGTVSFKGEDKKSSNNVSRYGGVISVSWNGETKDYDMGKSADKKAIGALPFAYYGEGYLNNNPEWQ